MNLSPTEVRACVFAVAQFRRAAAMAGRRVPPSVAALADRLDHELRFGVSPARQECDCAAGQLESTGEHAMEWIGTRMAAGILGWELRRVQRHAADLDGQLVGARWVFPRRSVDAYANGLEDK